MYRFYTLTDFRIPRLIALATHCAAAALIIFYLEDRWLQSCAIAFIVINAAADYRRLIRQGNIRLRVDPLRPGIEFEQFGQPYLFCKYKVYQTRWFAILKLIDHRKGRTLILHPGSFSNPESYRGLRYDLRRLERDHAA